MALTTIDDLVTRVIQRIQNDGSGELSPERSEVSNVIEGAILRLSRLSPRVTSTTLSGDGSAYDFAFSAFSPSWVAGFSVVRWVEYPADTQDPVFLDRSEWMYWPDVLDASASLRFRDFIPASGTDNIRVSYTTVHTLSDSASTLSDVEDLAAEYFGACAACELYATTYAHTTSGNLEADAIDFQSRSAEWRTLGEMFCGKGREALGLKSDEEGGSESGGGAYVGGWADHDIPNSIYGSPIWRNRKQR